MIVEGERHGKMRKIVTFKYERNVSFEDIGCQIEEEYSRFIQTYANVTKTTESKATQTANKRTQIDTNPQHVTTNKDNKDKTTFKSQKVDFIRGDMA